MGDFVFKHLIANLESFQGIGERFGAFFFFSIRHLFYVPNI